MAERIIARLKAIAHPARFAILQALVRGESNVGEIESATGIGQPLLSQQLSVLRKADLVLTRRAAKLVFYRIEPRALADLAQMIAALAGPAGHADADGNSAFVRPADNPVGSKSTGGAAVFARIG